MEETEWVPLSNAKCDKCGGDVEQEASVVRGLDDEPRAVLAMGQPLRCENGCPDPEAIPR
ncbi:hypothetical protein ACOKM5_24260 [Streptomyces sp. BH097]|uniref:hypothetical protein n=1 Tax=Streptomyces sp. BH097 TaxID=3410406 RepID=UPI003CEEB123